MIKLTNLLKESILDNMNQLSFYLVSYETYNSIEHLYDGFDFKKAELEYDSFNHSDMEKRYYDLTVNVVLEVKVNNYKFIDNNESISDYPLADYYDDSDLYELIDEGDYELIKSREIKPINDDSDSLLFDVNQYFKSKYGNTKYNTIYVDDDESSCIQLRIADHTENVSNNDKYGKCNYYISVVITDYDVTKDRFKISNHFDSNKNEYTLNYTSDDNFDIIIADIENLIDDLSNKLI